MANDPTPELPAGYVRVMAPAGERELPDNKQTAERVLLEGYELLEGELSWTVDQGERSARRLTAEELAARDGAELEPAEEPAGETAEPVAPWAGQAESDKVADVFEWAEKDATGDRARAALEFENAQANPRASLVTKLEGLVPAGDGAEVPELEEAAGDTGEEG